MTEKICTKCGETKTLGAFRDNRNECKSCASEYRKNQYIKNAEKEKSYRKNWYKDNVEKASAVFKKYYLVNSEKLKNAAKKHRTENKEQVSLYNKKYYNADIDNQKKRVSDWRKNNPEKKSDQDRARRARKRASEGFFKPAEWQEKKDEYGNLCVYCNKKTKLTADHIVPIKVGGSSYIENIVPACHSCNSSKKATPLILWMYNRLVTND